MRWAKRFPTPPDFPKAIRMPHEFTARENGHFSPKFDPARVVASFDPPASLEPARLRQRVEEIVEGRAKAAFPLVGAILPGDSVAIAVSGSLRDTVPLVATLVAAFEAHGIPMSALHVIVDAGQAGEFRAQLPEAVSVAAHDPAVGEASAYLANTRRGSRVYLNREMLDCDVIVPVIVPEPRGIEARSGFLRGFWPEFSRDETRAKLEAEFRGNPRGVRREIREVSWLAGIPAVLIGIPGRAGVADLQALPPAQVQAWAYGRSNDLWNFPFDPVADSVLAIANDPDGLSPRRAKSLLKLAGKLAVRYRKLVIWARLGDDVLAAMEQEAAREPGARKPWLAACGKIGRSANVSWLGNLREEVADDCEIILLDEPEDLERQINRGGRWIIVDQAWGVRALFPD